MFDGRFVNRPEITAVEASRVKRGCDPNCTGSDYVVAKRPMRQWPAGSILGFWHSVRDWDAIDVDSAARELNPVSSLGHNCFKERSSSVRTPSRGSDPVLALDRQSRE